MTAVREEATRADANPPANSGDPKDGSEIPLARRMSVPVTLCVVVALCAQVPTLFNPSFYFTDDSAAQFLPMWYQLGDRLLAGDWPLLLDVDAWMGGNLAGEAMFGIWNPVNLACYVLVFVIGDLAVAATFVKSLFLVILALGTYLLCREYGARRGPAFVLAAALPFSGFVLYFQAATWAAGLIAFAWVPWVWAFGRKAAYGRRTVLAPFVFGALCVTAGNPYGLLGVCLVYLGLLVELLVARGTGWAPVRRLALLVVCVGATAPLVFLPLVGASATSWRSGGLVNNGNFSPAIDDLVNFGMASNVPQINTWGGDTVDEPVVYLCWFLLLLVPWLSWRAMGTRWRELAGALVVCAVYFLLCIGPSNVWLWRWPVRHITMLFLTVCVLSAVLLSAGLRQDRLRLRARLTCAVLLAGGFLSFSATPSLSAEHLVCMAIMGVLIAVALRTRSNAVFFGALQLGTVIMLVLQMMWIPANRDLTTYNFPTSAERLQGFYADRQGTVVQIARFAEVPAARVADRSVWQQLLFGNMYLVAGVPSLVSYTGIGHKALHNALCLGHNGATCPDAYARLWQSPIPGGPNLADSLRARTVVVQRSLIDSPEVPLGWEVVHRDAAVTVLDRTALPRHPNGRLSWVSPGVSVVADVMTGERVERVRFRAAGSDAQLIFARVAWPGYQATVNGVPVPVGSTPAGLVTVELPDGVGAGELRLVWTPPGLWIGLAGAALAGLVTIAVSIGQLVFRRRSRRVPR